MLGFRYLKTDPSTYVIKMVNGKVKAAGVGKTFFYYGPSASIVAVPVSSQEVPFIFNQQTSDFQAVSVQGQLTYRVVDPQALSAMANFTLDEKAERYVSDDPVELNDRILKLVQVVVRDEIQRVKLDQALLLAKGLTVSVSSVLGAQDSILVDMGLEIVQVTIASIEPTPETARALEARAREAILKDADDALYDRRRFAVEQESSLKEAELNNELKLQEREREIEEAKIEADRRALAQRAVIRQEKIASEIKDEQARQEYVELASENTRKQADADAYATKAQMVAFAELPLDNLKALASTSMTPEQLMAQAVENLAGNAGKIGELNISPDILGQLFQRSQGAEK